MKIKLLLLGSFAFLFSVFAYANSTPGKGEEASKPSDIVGGVFDNETKKGIANVTVTIYISSKKEKVLLTDAYGNFSFDNLKPGTYKFIFEKEGYKKVTKEKVLAKANEGLQMNIEMEEHSFFDFMPSPSNFFDFNDPII